MFCKPQVYLGKINDTNVQQTSTNSFHMSHLIKWYGNSLSLRKLYLGLVSSSSESILLSESSLLNTSG